MSTLYLSHRACHEHHPAPGHPENAERLKAIETALEVDTFDALIREEAPLADVRAIELAHPSGYFEAIQKATPIEGRAMLDGDTAMSPGSFTAALHAVGAGIAAVDRVMDENSALLSPIRTAFCAVRPPGHHAERNQPMGFCLFSNIAIAAFHARNRHNAERVAVIDFDVHHGNGTQDVFWADQDMFYGSTHQMPLFPGTGALRETGAGNIFNAPLRSGDGSEPFKAAMRERIFPAIKNFAPDLILISAGFDAHRADPLGGMMLEAEDFSWVTLKLAELAHRFAGGRMVSMLEGGYDLDALGASAAAHIEALMQAGG